MFVNQKKLQRRLLGRYGNSICLLDATYKTTKYSLQLFFVVVKTNVNYHVVARLYCKMRQPLQLQRYCQSYCQSAWELKCFMVDNCDEEIKSIRNIFPRTYMKCFNLFVLITNLFIVQKTMHF